MKRYITSLVVIFATLIFGVVLIGTSPQIQDFEPVIDGEELALGAYFSGYGFCEVMTLNSAYIATTTTNGYVVLATTTQTVLKTTTNGGNVEKDDGLDIVFTTGTDCATVGTTLDYYLESYASTTGAMVAWIESTDISSTTDKTMLMYYGNASATDQSNESGVYNSTYKSVWNMSEDPSITAPQILDSTSNNNDGTSSGSMTAGDQVDGQIGGSLDFDGTDDKIAVADVSITQGLTVLAVAKMNSPSQSGFKHVVGHHPGWFISADENNSIMRFGLNSGSDTSTEFDSLNTLSTKYNMYVGTYDGTTIRTYVNGVAMFTAANTGNVTQTGNTSIGSYSESTGFVWDGNVDEVRIYNTAIDPMDILTDYNMMFDNTSFLSFGTEQADGGTVTTPYQEDVYLFGF